MNCFKLAPHFHVCLNMQYTGSKFYPRNKNTTYSLIICALQHKQQKETQLSSISSNSDTVDSPSSCLTSVIDHGLINPIGTHLGDDQILT